MKGSTPPQYATIFAVLVAAITGFAGDVAAFDTPRIDSPVVDQAGVLNGFEEEAIGERLRSHYDKTGVQMAVLLVETTGYTPIDEYSIRVANEWGGGRAGEDRGVLLTLAIQDRRSRLEVGYGLEPVLTDPVSARILADIRPELRQKRYGDAVSFAVDDVIDRTEHLRPGERVTPTLAGWWESPIRGFWSALLFGVFLVGLLSLLRRFEVGFMGQKRGFWTIVGAVVIGAIVVAFATKGVMWHGYVVIFLWGGLLGLTVRGEENFVWGVPLVSYLALAGATLAIPKLDESVILGESGWSLANTALVHCFYVMMSYSLWLGATTEGGASGSSTYSSSGSSSGSSFSGGGYSGGGGSFGGGGASGGW